MSLTRARGPLRAACLVAVLATAGCRAAPSPPVASQPSASVVGPTASSGATSPGVQRPSIPAGFPVVADAERLDPQAADPGLIAAWRTPQSGAAVYQFYLEALPETGFEVVGEYPGGAAAIIRFGDGDGSAVFDVALTADGDGTRVQLRTGGG